MTRQPSFLFMTQKLFLFVVLSCMFCKGQSVLTTPTESTRSVPGSSNTPSTGAASAPMRSPQQTGERTDSDGIPFSPVPALHSGSVQNCWAAHDEVRF